MGFEKQIWWYKANHMGLPKHMGVKLARDSDIIPTIYEYEEPILVT